MTTLSKTWASHPLRSIKENGESGTKEKGLFGDAGGNRRERQRNAECSPSGEHGVFEVPQERGEDAVLRAGGEWREGRELMAQSVGRLVFLTVFPVTMVLVFW